MPAVLRLNDAPLGTEGVNFQQLFDGIPDPVLYIGADNRIAACNRAFRERFPILVESRFLESIQKTLEDERGVVPFVRPKRQSIAGGATWPALEPRITRLASGGMLVVFQPIKRTELEQHERIENLRRDLRAAEDEARNAMGMVSGFIKNFAHVSHELRTPLNAVVGFADIIRQETLGPAGDARYQRYGDIIYHSGLRLLELVNDVLDYAKMDAGKFELHAEEVEVFRVVIESVRELELQAAKSRIGICIRVHDGVSVIVAEPKRLRQMLTNLLSNAIKFTPGGGEVSIDVYKRSENIAISVSDTGIGMSQSEIPAALEPFARLPAGARFNSTGTGLGLPLTRRLAEVHGGTMEVESAPGCGTTVTVVLPQRDSGLCHRNTSLSQTARGKRT